MAAYAAQNGTCGDGEYDRKPLTPPLGTTRIRGVVTEVGQRPHLFGNENDLGFYGKLKVRPVGLRQVFLWMMTERTNKNPLGGRRLLNYGRPGCGDSLGSIPVQSSSRRDRPLQEAQWIDKGLEQQQRMTKTGLPIRANPPFGQ
ncbi:protein of unknown function [Georgfuchsia toluolica]|uniref:Uncharacterized protein n=1 Tax=Georgfuchsia toluolica TaxID=424218 RepID=A0A916N1M9_9PROT|nr:protein of unknown function [Georgfuchsia toluolica]